MPINDTRAKVKDMFDAGFTKQEAAEKTGLLLRSIGGYYCSFFNEKMREKKSGS
ncbi:MAG: hypothetical protein V4549_18020 [Bacteroidota bacterium]